MLREEKGEDLGRRRLSYRTGLSGFLPDSRLLRSKAATTALAVNTEHKSEQQAHHLSAGLLQGTYR